MQKGLEGKEGCWRKKKNATHDPKGSFQPTNNEVQLILQESLVTFWGTEKQCFARPRVVSESGEGKLEAVYATKQLEILLENSKEMFLVEEDRFARKCGLC